MPVDSNGMVSLINSNSKHIPPLRVFELLILDVVLVLPDERLPDENDEPSEIIELGRCVDLWFSGRTPENEFRNLGAVKMKHTTV